MEPPEPRPTPPDELRSALSRSYRIEQELGEGGTARVYLAADLKHGRQVAIKVLRPELAAVVGAERFLAEIRTTAGLQHPHILPLFDSGEAAGSLYYVMPFVEGETLRERLDREGPLGLDEARGVARDVASALAHAHARGIVHRDVKPANVLLGAGGALVADFGVALALAGSGPDRLTVTGLSVGTPAYMSPEQMGGEPTVDARTDIYALACLVYEMLAGEPPFVADSFQALVAKVLTEPPPSLRARRGDVPRAVDAALSRAMAKRPGDRFDSVDAFWEALTPEPSGFATRRRSLIGPAVWAGGGLLVVGIAGAVAWKALQRSEARALLPEIDRLAAEGDFVEAYDRAVEAERWLGADTGLARRMAQVSDVLTVRTEPSGAEVTVQRFDPDDEGERVPEPVGVTPLRDQRLPRASHRLVVRLEGFSPVERVASTELHRERAPPGEARELTFDLRLTPEGEHPPDMVPVDGGPYELVRSDAPGVMSVTLDPFLMDRTEVTQSAYAAFLAAGGYGRDEFWTEVTDDVRARLVDRTGLPGPRGWVGQTFPEGSARQPVRGVTWYEARAYCLWAGKRLPTLFEWEKTARDGQVARRGVLMPWGPETSGIRGTRRANFNSTGPSDVDAHPFDVGPWGAHGMAGNVREWTANASGEGRVTAGGSWEGPSYLYLQYASEAPDFASPGLGFRCAHSAGEGDQGAGDLDLDAPPPTYTPVDEETFRTLLAHYRYDAVPARPRTTHVDTTSGWVRERVWIDGLAGDSILVYVYTPLNAAPPYQTLVYVGSLAAFFTDRLPDRAEWMLGPVIRGGRALVAPVLDGMIERGLPPGTDTPEPHTVGFRDRMVRHATELRLAMDYAQGRPDVDGGALVYVGVSWGAGSRLVFSAVDDRYRAVVYIGGGIDERVKPTLPEADNVNFAPYVRVPKLLLNGRNDEEHPWLSRALPLWELLTEPKELVLVDGAGHVVPLEARIPAINGFLDRTVGPVRRR